MNKNRPIKRYIAALMMIVSVSAAAQGVRFGNEAVDTLRINSLLTKAATIADPNERIAALAKEFLGTSYKGGTLEGEEEILTVDLEAMDCTTLVENVAALALTGGEARTSWHDFTYNLEKMRYRGGINNGYGSRLHYISDWIVDNSHRGNLTEVTDKCPDASYEVKTIDFMSTNRELYPRLSDPDSYQSIKNAEIGYRSHRFPLIKTKNVAKAAKGFLKDGDIVALTTAKKGLDVSHMGIIVYQDGAPHLLHASSKEGKVTIDKLPLNEYLQRNRNLTGIRVIRLKE